MRPSLSTTSELGRADLIRGAAALDTQRYLTVRAATVELCAPLAVEDYVVQSMPDASPAKWHLAHTSWFFEEFVLGRAVADYRPVHESYRYLFNSYYNAVGPMHCRAARGMLSRPTVAEVLAYRSAVDERMASLLDAGSLPDGLREVLTLGLEHERQHQELLLTDIKHLFSLNPLLPAYRERSHQQAAHATALRHLRFAGGLTGIGHAGAGFCFDNELPRHRALIAPFRLANRPVTNGEYLEFVRAGGYDDPRLWLSDGWALARREGWERPIYWSRSLEEEFTLTGLRALGGGAAAHGIRVGAGGGHCAAGGQLPRAARVASAGCRRIRHPAADVRRCLGVDSVRLCTVSRLLAAERRAR
jgi:ergothioneine biosynthesis protein EgtB